MPRGSPDWGEYAPIQDLYKTLDYGEIAARTGSLVGFDRKGNVIFVDDCSSGVSRWNKIEWPGERVVGKYGYNIFGGYSIYIEDNGLDGNKPGIYTSLPIFKNSKAGLEIIGSFAYGRTLVEMMLQFDDGSQLLTFMVGFNNNDGTISLYDKSLGWVTFGYFNPMPSGAMWTWYAKMVVDPVSGKYNRFKFNGEDFDIANYLAMVGQSNYAQLTVLQVTAGYAVANSYGGINLNGVIFTVNE